MRPILAMFRSVRELQQLRREAPGTTPVEEIERRVREMLSHLDAHQRQVAEQVAAAGAPALEERMNAALAAWEGFRSEVELRLENLVKAEAHETQKEWKELDDQIAKRLRGAGVRTKSDIFELAPRTTRGTATAISSERSVVFLPPQPEAEDLQPLYGAHPAIAAKVAELERDPERIFRFVAEQIGLSLYTGHFRAPAEVLADGTGNDADLAGLLVELLRAAGHPARLLIGPVRESLRDLGTRVDVLDRDVLTQLLKDSGRQVFTQANGDDVSADIAGRAWVQAWIGQRWVDLDPSERTLDVEPGTALTDALLWTPIGETAHDESLERQYLHDKDARDGPLPFYERRLRDAVKSLRVRRVRPVESFPPPLVATRLFGAFPRRAFEDGDSWRIEVQLNAVLTGDVLTATRALPGRNRAAWLLTWRAASPAAEALEKSGAGLGALPPFAMELRPRLQILDENGSVLETIDGTSTTYAGTEVYFQIVLHAPLSFNTQRSQARIVAGEPWAMRIEAPGVELVNLPIPKRLPPVNGEDAGRAALLPSLLEIYHRRLAATARRVAALSGGVALSGPWVSLLGSHLDPLIIAGETAALRASNWRLDVKMIDFRLYPSGNAMSLRGLEELFLAHGSWLEAAWFRDLLAKPASSTIEALRQAVAEGIPLVTIGRDDEEALSSLDHPMGVIFALRFALQDRHRSVTIPKRPIRFGTTEIAAWIARRDATPPSEYAIAGLWGGYCDDDDDDDWRTVVIYRTRDRILVDIGVSEDFGALAYDDEGRNLTPFIRWSSVPEIGAGTGGGAKFTPTKPGAAMVVAEVFEGPGLRFGGRTADASLVNTPVIIIKKITCESPAVELQRAEKGAVLQRVEGPLFPPQDPPTSLGLWIGGSVDVTLTLEILDADGTPFNLRIKAEDPVGQRVNVEETLEYEVQSGEREVTVTIDTSGPIGVVENLRWHFAVDDNPYHEERDRETAIEIFVSRKEPKPHHDIVEQKTYRWACQWAKDMDASTADEIVLVALLENRAASKLRYGGYLSPGDSSREGYELVGNERGMCQHFADWFVALGGIHGIQGQRYEVKFDNTVADRPNWQRWLCTSIGLNSLPFNSPGSPRHVVKKGNYVTGGTRAEDVEVWGAEGQREFLDNQFWIFTQHFLAEFQGTLYDASFEPNSKIRIPGFHGGRYVVHGGDNEQRKFFINVMPILIGTVPIDGDPENDVHVWHSDDDAKNEPLRLLFTAR